MDSVQDQAGTWPEAGPVLAHLLDAADLAAFVERAESHLRARGVPGVRIARWHAGDVPAGPDAPLARAASADGHWTLDAIRQRVAVPLLRQAEGDRLVLLADGTGTCRERLEAHAAVLAPLAHAVSEKAR